MANPVITHAPTVKILVEGIDGEPDWAFFEWMAMANGGYVMRARIHDPYLNFLDKMSKILLQKARNGPLICKFTIKWIDGEQTDEMEAWVTDVAAAGSQLYNQTEIIAIDPPSWALNAGKSSGEVFKGKVSTVIQDVCKKYQINGAPQVSVTTTKDDENNQWWMMRQDPKTFIQMLLDWSSSAVPKKTCWVTNCKNKQMEIKEQADLPNIDLGTFQVNVRSFSAASDIHSVSLESDTLLALWQTQMHTQGLSAVSGKYLDNKVAKDSVVVKDENTSNKINSACTAQESFKKPTKEWSTSMLAIPEHNAGDVGMKYQDYIDGRPRNMYISQLNLVHRICVRTQGNCKVKDPLGLDGSTCNLTWKNEKGENYWLGGKWIVYGFHHQVSREMFVTDLYCRRGDFDEAAERR